MIFRNYPLGPLAAVSRPNRSTTAWTLASKTVIRGHSALHVLPDAADDDPAAGCSRSPSDNAGVFSCDPTAAVHC